MSYTIRRYYTFHKMDKDEAASWDNKITRAMNAVSNKKVENPYSVQSNEYGTLLEMAVELVLSQLATDGDEIDAANDAIAKKVKDIRAMKADTAMLVEIYESMDFDAFVEFCDSNGIDWYEFCQREYALFKDEQNLSWSERARRWLDTFLIKGEPTDTDKIIFNAKMFGIIDQDNFDRDWNKLKVVASRLGYSSSGRRNQWLRP